MATRFLLGPAGSGKTFRCLEEVRAELAASPDGPPLLFIAPKQATFQLERQLLADESLGGYTRLEIVSFERLATRILERLDAPVPSLLDEEGRLMVLRALLARRQDELKIFHANARMTGFARQASLILREFQQHDVNVAELRRLSGRFGSDSTLGRKLHDLAVALEAYLAWLAEHGLNDADNLFDAAIEAVKADAGGDAKLRFGGVWMDGFGELPPKHLRLLAALLPQAERATLAFCLDDPGRSDRPWHSPWSPIHHAFQRCGEELEAAGGVHPEVEVLARREAANRFERSPELRYLEAAWSEADGVVPNCSSRREEAHSNPDEEDQSLLTSAATALEQTDAGAPVAQASEPAVSPVSKPAGRGTTERAEQEPPPRSIEGDADLEIRDTARLETCATSAVRVVACPTPEAEAVFAARTIRRFVRESDARFRDCAVIVRSLEDYRHILRRVFQRFEIPFFLDRREPVGHHPFAELTRAAIRIAAHGWRHEDWFCALKSGLVSRDEFAIDRLENEALANGWEGDFWRKPLVVRNDDPFAERLEEVRAESVPPFERFVDGLNADGPQATGPQLAAALGRLWKALDVESRLEKWNENAASPIHGTVWEEMNKWLGNVERAFPDEAIPLRDWLPILEAGLGGLTVGAIPPAIDQVLVGAVDRSRNPDLRLALVLGANEGVFPAAPKPTGLISDHERERLAGVGAQLGPDRYRRIGLERYYAYIACTRARERLVVTFAQRNLEDAELTPSSFVHRILRLFPGLEIEKGANESGWRAGEHVSELAAPLMRRDEEKDAELTRLLELPVVRHLRERAAPADEPDPAASLAPDLAARLYGPTLRSSVSRIERFAACPFRFFADSGMQAEERRVFQIDARERGSFQHEILERFHDELKAEGKRWRDITPAEAGERVARLADAFADEYREGLFRATDKNLFAVESLSRDLREFIETVVGWMNDYGFDPVEVELDFGGEGGSMPAWEFDLGEGARMAFNGKIDRVDLAVDPDTGRADCVVIDYKSSGRKVDMTLLRNGVQIQLPAYLAALWRTPDPARLFEGQPIREINPLGAFYVNLRGSFSSAGIRDEAIGDLDADRRQAYQHAGRYSLEAQDTLDLRRVRDGEPSGQFAYRLTKEGKPYKNSNTVMEAAAFRELLLRVETKLREMGQAIFHGEAAVDPYQHGRKTACDYCEYRSVCRIDPWRHAYRALEEEG